MENVKVWQDFVDRWYASVPLTDSRQQDATAARDLIREAIADKHDLPADRVRELHVTRDRITGHGTAIYREI